MTMHWNYRIVQKFVEGENLHEMYEVYYDDDGKITAWTEGPVAPSGETFEGLVHDLDRMMKALTKPILGWDELEKESDNE